MAGKFLQTWSLRTVAKTVAVLAIIIISVAIFATRKIPDTENEDEWEFWRNLDFSICVVSLAFASALLYGSITEFRMFVLAWMIWNVVLVIFWIVFLIIKDSELEEWERTFRIVAICLMAISEIPVFNYFRYLRVKDKDDKPIHSWTDPEKAYKSLTERPSFTSIDETFGKNPGRKNLGFQSDSPRDSVVSEATEQIEVDNEDGKEKLEGTIEPKNEKMDEQEERNMPEKQNESDVESQSSFEISVTVHTHATEAPESDSSAAIEREGSDSNAKNEETPSSTTAEDEKPGTSSNYVDPEEDERTANAVPDSCENQIPVNSSMDITEDKVSTRKDVGAVVEMKDVKTVNSSDESSVSVEMDVTDMASEESYQTSF